MMQGGCLLVSRTLLILSTYPSVYVNQDISKTSLPQTDSFFSYLACDRSVSVFWGVGGGAVVSSILYPYIRFPRLREFSLTS